MPFLLAFLALPIIEIALFILVGGWIGLWPTLGLVIAAAFAGTALMRSAGAQAGQRIRASMMQDQDPSADIVRMAMTFVAGMLLIVPGFLTDAVALVLLVPQVQRAAFNTLRRRARMSGGMSGMTMGATFGGPPQRPRPPADRVIDAEYEDVTRQNPPQGPSRWTQD
jgi:UPF0716 protein FxsA